MQKFAVIKTGGKQYLVKEGSEIIIDKVDQDKAKEIDLEILATFDCDDKSLELGTPTLSSKIKATVIDHLKGDKIRVARFKAKSRYRKVKGFRAQLTKIKILKIN